MGGTKTEIKKQGTKPHHPRCVTAAFITKPKQNKSISILVCLEESGIRPPKSKAVSGGVLYGIPSTCPPAELKNLNPLCYCTRQGRPIIGDVTNGVMIALIDGVMIVFIDGVIIVFIDGVV